MQVGIDYKDKQINHTHEGENMSTQEIINNVRNYFADNKPFFLTATVSAPYDGCVYEPNIFLVTPPNSELFAELNSMVDSPKSWHSLIVFPLYATGQGVALDCIRSLEELEQVVESEEIAELAKRDEGSLLNPDKLWGSIRNFSTSNYGPINKNVCAGERYWMRALQVASEKWNIDLHWHCSECGKDIEYNECEGVPQPTGYHGDGGIGVHYTNVMCWECTKLGACEQCKEGGNPTEYYDDEVKEYGWHLCAYCTSELAKAANFTGEVDLPNTVSIAWYKNSEQTELAGFVAKKVLTLLVDDKPVEGITFDASALLDYASKNCNLRDRLDHNYGHGLQLSGTTIENIAYDNCD